MVYIYSKNEKGNRQFNPFIEYFEINGLSYEMINNIRELKDNIKFIISENDKEEIIIYVGQIDDYYSILFSLWRYKGNVKIIYRSRGILPEESYLRNKSKIRFKILSIMEFIVLKTSDIILTVSDNQKTHFIEKYSIDSEKMFTIHNYLNVEQYKVLNENKTSNIEFVYVGSLSKWQSFDEIVILCSKLQKEIENIQFLFCVDKNQIESAKEKAMQNKLKNVEIVNLEYKDMIERISISTAGIILRDKNIINKVASPFKTIDYIQAGLPIVISNSVGDYPKVFKDIDFVYSIDINDIKSQKCIEEIKEFLIKVYEEKNINSRVIEFAKNTLCINKEIEEFYLTYSIKC